MKLLEEQREANRQAVREDHTWRAEQARIATNRFWIGGVLMMILSALIGLLASILGGLISAGRI